ncbi:MAG TPA: TlpA disulfide reductase family protein [Candidatus Polarisedimenticolia bacterium]|nr:TlpA disulfide reductase family protein [Candidatus Polarisedimenticolia bacterium]
MRFPCHRVLPLGIAGLLLFAACVFAQAEPPTGKPGSRSGQAAAAEDPPLIDLDGYNQVIAKYRGKPLVVNFWATWCQPCRSEFPMLVELAKQFAPQGLVVVGVSLDDNADLNLVRHFLAESHPGFPNYREKPGINVDAFYRGVNPQWRGTMPQTIFYGRDGHIARYLVGARPRAAFEGAIRLILASPSAQNVATGLPFVGN